MAALTFTEALEQAEVLARQSLPPELHERLSCAVALVKDGRVLHSDAGHWTVDSVKTAGKVYSPNGSCSCADVQFNHPPQQLCKHRLAVYVARKTLALMMVAQTGAPEPVVIPTRKENCPCMRHAARPVCM
jgi:hypothetical protein